MFKKNYKNSTILSKNMYLPLDASYTNNNVMVVGASGRGKTRNVIEPNLMQMNSNYVISDPKGVLIEKYGIMLLENGYKLKMLNLVDMQHSDCYNPFQYLKSQSDVFKLVDFLMANINSDNCHHADPFWNNAVKSLLSAVIFYLREECNPEDQNFTNVMKLLRYTDASEGNGDYSSVLDILFEQLEKKYPGHVGTKQYAIFKSAGEGRTAKSILISTEVYLQHFNLEEYRKLTSIDTLCLEEVVSENTKDKFALFVIISDTDRSKNWLAGLFYSQLFDLLCEKEQRKNHIRFILDDFVCTGKIPDFDYKMAMIRSRNLSCMIVIQDEAQLEKEYEKAAKGIITNCDSYIFLGASNIEACNDVSKRLARKRITGAYIRNMGIGFCVVICGNKGGIYKKYCLEHHPQYKKNAGLYYDYTQDFDIRKSYSEKYNERKLDARVDTIKKLRSSERKGNLLNGKTDEFVEKIMVPELIEPGFTDELVKRMVVSDSIAPMFFEETKDNSTDSMSEL